MTIELRVAALALALALPCAAAAETAGDDYAKYQKHLELLHKMIVHAMKAKQTTDLANVDSLRKAANEFHDLYFSN